MTPLFCTKQARSPNHDCPANDRVVRGTSFAESGAVENQKGSNNIRQDIETLSIRMCLVASPTQFVGHDTYHRNDLLPADRRMPASPQVGSAFIQCGHLFDAVQVRTASQNDCVTRNSRRSQQFRIQFICRQNLIVRGCGQYGGLSLLAAEVNSSLNFNR